MISLDLHSPLAAFALEVKLTIEARATAILGPSGAGKTTLLEVIAGLRPATGTVKLDGEVLLDSTARIRLPPERRKVGYVPQDALLFPHLTVRGNIFFGANATARAANEAVFLLELAPLLNRRPATLSGGERQRVSLARALATSPRLLLLDEPLAALDVELKERILPYLLRVRDEARVPFLYVTHQAGEAQALAQEALVIDHGRVRAHGPVREVLSAAVEPGGSYENVLVGTLLGNLLTVPGGPSLIVPPAPELPPGARAAFAVPAEDVLVSNHPLEGVSARNVLEARVAAVEDTGAGTFLRADAGGTEWRAKLTREAARELKLEAGARIWLAVKTHSLRRLR
ncbi:MAG: molybdenum ABC transporter ATP-binding protein [Myxococcaceae bacterium]